MKRTLPLLCAAFCVAPVLAQNKEKTTVTTKTTTVKKSGANLLAPLWSMTDAVPIETHSVDLRMGTWWVTASDEANLTDSDDDYSVTPSLVWGPCDNVEISFSVPVWVGDGGEMPAFSEGNADTYIGMLWRLVEQNGMWPALALASNLRTPTGDNSNGLDAELRLVLTNEYDSGIRSHVNLYGNSVNTDNEKSLMADDNDGGFGWGSDDDDWDSGLGWGWGRDRLSGRHFQWGAVFGLDGPLCSDGAVRWVADYVHKSSAYYGNRNSNLLELGWEWNIDEQNKLGMATQVGLDDNEETPNFGAGFTYAYSMKY